MLVCSFGLLERYPKTNFSLILKVPEILFAHNLHLQSQIPHPQHRSGHSIQDSQINSKEFLSRQFFRVGRELTDSNLTLCSFFIQYWLLISRDPCALMFALPTIIIATGLNFLESLSLIDIDLSKLSIYLVWYGGHMADIGKGSKYQIPKPSPLVHFLLLKKKHPPWYG